MRLERLHEAREYVPIDPLMSIWRIKPPLEVVNVNESRSYGTASQIALLPEVMQVLLKKVGGLEDMEFFIVN